MIEAKPFDIVRWTLAAFDGNEEASDGQEALLRVAEAKPDLVLLDWMLPSLSGLEVCRQLRRRPPELVANRECCRPRHHEMGLEQRRHLAQELEQAHTVDHARGPGESHDQAPG